MRRFCLFYVNKGMTNKVVKLLCDIMETHKLYIIEDEVELQSEIDGIIVTAIENR